LPRKNIKLFGGKPLIAHTIEAARGSYFINRVVVSTEDKEIAEVAKKYGAEIIKRPKKLAGDKILIQAVIAQVLKDLKKKENYRPYGIALLNPTSPLRTTEHLNAALTKFCGGGYDSVFTVYGCHMCLWKFDEKGRMAASYDFIHHKRRQDMPQEYAENGAVYAFTTEYFERTGRFIGGNMRWSVMPRANSVDINNLLDFTIAEALLKDMNENPSHKS
jgi:CMP-N-acetylneuraminic acid synthetase